MYIIVQLLLLLSCILMFKLSREYKIALLLLSTICFDAVTFSFVPFGGARYILSHCFILSELPNIIQHIKSIRKTVLKPLMLLVIFASIILLINSPHYNKSIGDIIRLFIYELTGKYFVLFYAFVSITSIDKMRPLLKISFYGLLVLTFFGIWNLLTMRSFFIDAVGAHMNVGDNLQDLGGKFTQSVRFRVQSMFFNPFNYGYICILLLLFLYWGYLKRMLSKRQMQISTACCLFGVIFCGCRTNILCCAIGIVSFICLAFTIRKRAKYAIIGSILCIIAYGTIPTFQEKVDQTLTVFDVNSQYAGSSIDMRILQFSAVLFHINGYELFGRGLGFFEIDMGWGEGQYQTLIDKDLWGLEGAVMSYLLERGLVGVILYLVAYILLIYYAFRHRKYDKITSAFCISILLVYIAFANMTGELKSVFPTLLLVGCCLKLLFIKHVQQRTKSQSISLSSNESL